MKSFVRRKNVQRLIAIGSQLAAVGDFFERIRNKLSPSSYDSSTRFALPDHAAALAMAFIAAVVTYHGFLSIDPRVYDSWNIYFHADGIRVLADMTDRFSDQSRTSVHPIFSILGFSAMRPLMALGLGGVAAAGVLLVLSAALSGALFYLTLRGLGLPLAAAILFCLAFLASATFIHWYAYIETYAFAALTVVVTLFVLTMGRRVRLWGWCLASSSALAVTITNWGLPLVAAFFRLPFMTFIKITAGSLLLVAALACVQKATFPTSLLFFDLRVLRWEVNYTQSSMEARGHTRWTPFQNMRSVLISSAVAPRPVVEDAHTVVGVFKLVNNQYTPFFSASATGFAALVCWLFLLAVGVWGVWRENGRHAVAIPIMAYLLFQLALHLIYGEITFLFAGNFFPALMMVAAFGWFTPLRNLVASAAVGFIILGGINNYTEFLRATRLSSEIAAHLAATGEALCVPTCGRRDR